MTQGQIMSPILTLIINLHHHIIHQKGLMSIRPRSMNLGNSSIHIRRHQNLMRMNNLILIHNPHNIPPRHGHTLLNRRARGKRPPHIPRQTRDIHPLGHIDIPTLLKDMLQRPLNPIKNRPHNPGTQLHTQRLLLPQHRIPHRQPRSVLIHLNRGSVPLKLDDFSDELGVSDADEFVHGGSGHVVGDYEGAGDFEDEAVVGFFGFVVVD
mmetsp:Transcript_32161/g.48204  ORF Transcript_32161/g.48204 Transcript_32161/m.48204 type:complete len:209 (+) Transcript_32161:1428-2054(+)